MKNTNIKLKSKYMIAEKRLLKINYFGYIKSLQGKKKQKKTKTKYLNNFRILLNKLIMLSFTSDLR